MSPVAGRHGSRPSLRCNLIEEGGRLQALSRHLQLENVEAVIIADHIMKLFRFDALGDIDVLIQQSLRLAERVAENFA